MLPLYIDLIVMCNLYPLITVFRRYFKLYSTLGNIFSLQKLAPSLSKNVLQKFENRLTTEKVLPKNSFD